MADLPIGSNLQLGSRRIKGLRDGLQWYQTFTLHAVGAGQQDMPIWLPYDCTLVKLRYRIATAGTGGSLAAELRLNGTATGNLLTGTNLTPTTSPSWSTPGNTLAEDDLLWCWVTSINTTTVGAQLKVEAVLERR